MVDEQRRFGDLVILPAHDGVTGTDKHHGGRAVAEKALAWFVYTATNTTMRAAKFVAKIDDDTLANLPRMVSELRQVAADAVYGVQVYRLWNWNKQPTVGDAACGDHSEIGPPKSNRLLKSLEEAVKPGGKCVGSLGPYPFPDGSLEVYGRKALDNVFGSQRVRAFADDMFKKPKPPFWSHEDAGLGALVHREVVDRQMPLTYVAMRRWEHNRFWLNWADRSTLIDGDVQWAHYTRDAPRGLRWRRVCGDGVAACRWPVMRLVRQAVGMECAGGVERLLREAGRNRTRRPSKAHAATNVRS